MTKKRTAKTVVSVSENVWSERRNEERIIYLNTSL